MPISSSTRPHLRRPVHRGTRLIKLVVAVLGAMGAVSACVPTPTEQLPIDATTTSAAGLWLSTEEIRRLPMQGPAWEAVVAAAIRPSGPNVADQDSDHDVHTLAAALVYARTGDGSMRRRAAEGVLGAMGTEVGGRTLALGRNLVSYIIAADTIDLRDYDRAGDDRFRNWLSAVRGQTLDGKTLVGTYAERPNNWGTHAGASLTAIAAYLGERPQLERLARIFRGWLGDQRAYAGFRYSSDTSWQADPSQPAGINPAGATVAGYRVDGALPEELRRGCSFQWPPCHTGYTWGALQGAVVHAPLLARQGFDVWAWSDRALLRAVRFHLRLERMFGGWWAESEDAWLVPLVNRAYGVAYPVPIHVGMGKNMAFTAWTHG